MCCTLDYDKLYSVSLKDQHIERYFLYCEKSLESDPYLIFVFSHYFRRLQMKAAWKHIDYEFVSHEMDSR